MPSGSYARGTTIKILLLDGTPEGLRIIDNTNWNGLGMMCSRTKYPAFRDRPEFNFPGVYMLYGLSDAQEGGQSLYIGQADNIHERLDNHNRAKEFWTHLAVFTSRHGHLNKAHALYLESRLIDLALRARRANVVNGNAPRLPYLSESDRFDSESFLDQVLLLCPVLGLDFFAAVHQPVNLPVPVDVKPVSVTLGVTPRPPTRPDPAATLRLSGPGAKATGRAIGGGIEVFAGSVARLDTVPSLQGLYVRLREKLEADGVLKRAPEGLVFARNHTFKSPSGAAIVLMGRPASGWELWKDEQGRTLRSLQEMNTEGPGHVE